MLSCGYGSPLGIILPPNGLDSISQKEKHCSCEWKSSELSDNRRETKIQWVAFGWSCDLYMSDPTSSPAPKWINQLFRPLRWLETCFFRSVIHLFLKEENNTECTFAPDFAKRQRTKMDKESKQNHSMWISTEWHRTKIYIYI